MWVTGISLYYKVEKICKNRDKGELAKAIENAENHFASGGFAPEPPTRAMPWTHRGLGGPLDPSPKLVPPPKGQCLDPALIKTHRCLVSMKES